MTRYDRLELFCVRCGEKLSRERFYSDDGFKVTLDCNKCNFLSKIISDDSKANQATIEIANDNSEIPELHCPFCKQGRLMGYDNPVEGGRTHEDYEDDEKDVGQPFKHIHYRKIDDPLKCNDCKRLYEIEYF